MRRKILIDLDSSDAKDIYQAIAENGAFEKTVFTEEELNYLAQVGYFKRVKFKLGLLIDLYEEEVICDRKIMWDLLQETTDFKSEVVKTEALVFDKIVKALDTALKSNSCIYFIL